LSSRKRHFDRFDEQWRMLRIDSGCAPVVTVSSVGARID
jgi:hypothetical protein